MTSIKSTTKRQVIVPTRCARIQETKMRRRLAKLNGKFRDILLRSSENSFQCCSGSKTEKLEDLSASLPENIENF